MVFFQPDDTFITWIKVYAGTRFVLDVGSGEGHLVKRMWQCGIKAVGIDINIENMLDLDARLRTLGVDATKAPVMKMFNGVVLFCCPDHSNWVSETIRNNLHKDAEVLYISKPENLSIDLPGFSVELVPDVPGLLCEQVYRVLKLYPTE